MLLGIVVNQRRDLVGLQHGPAIQEAEFDQERYPDDLTAEALHHAATGRHGSPRGQKVVCHEHALSRMDRIAVHGDYVYMADNSPADIPDTGVVWIFDVSNPTAPTYAGSLMRSGKIFGWDIEGNYLYAATEFEGLVVFDISDPVNIFEAGVGDPYISRTRDVKVSGDYAFLLEDYDSLSVFNVSDPENPVLANRIENACYMGWQMTIEGDYLYLGAALGGVCIYDITDPVNPVLLGNYDTYCARNVLVSGDYAFVGDVDSLIILDVTDPANPASLGGYENPDGENHALARREPAHGVQLDGSTTSVRRAIQAIGLHRDRGSVVRGHVYVCFLACADQADDLGGKAGSQYRLDCRPVACLAEVHGT